jgi:hypothetical protein
MYTYKQTNKIFDKPTTTSYPRRHSHSRRHIRLFGAALKHLAMSHPPSHSQLVWISNSVPKSRYRVHTRRQEQRDDIRKATQSCTHPRYLRWCAVNPRPAPTRTRTGPPRSAPVAARRPTSPCSRSSMSTFSLSSCKLRKKLAVVRGKRLRLRRRTTARRVRLGGVTGGWVMTLCRAPLKYSWGCETAHIVCTSVCALLVGHPG